MTNKQIARELRTIVKRTKEIDCKISDFVCEHVDAICAALETLDRISAAMNRRR